MSLDADAVLPKPNGSTQQIHQTGPATQKLIVQVGKSVYTLPSPDVATNTPRPAQAGRGVFGYMATKNQPHPDFRPGGVGQKVTRQPIATSPPSLLVPIATSPHRY